MTVTIRESSEKRELHSGDAEFAEARGEIQEKTSACLRALRDSAVCFLAVWNGVIPESSEKRELHRGDAEFAEARGEIQEKTSACLRALRDSAVCFLVVWSGVIRKFCNPCSTSRETIFLRNTQLHLLAVKSRPRLGQQPGNRAQFHPPLLFGALGLLVHQPGNLVERREFDVAREQPDTGR